MFETSRPQDPKRRRIFFLELLPVSLTVHGIIAGAVILAGVWNVTFPSQSPKMYMAFRFADNPPPPPPPPPPPAARPQSVVRPVVKPPTEIVAPTVVPDLIPIVENELVPPEPEAVEGGVEGGIAGGELGGVVGGVEGGVMTPEAKAPPPTDGRVHVPRDEPLDLPILAQAHPIYPSKAASKGWEDRVVVRYVIGKDGRVKEVKIVVPPERKEFEEPTVRAIRLWRFRPFVRDGQKVEVVHELTVNYRLVRGG